MIQQILRYGAVGVINSGIGLTAIFAALYFFNFSDVAANAFGYAVGFGVSFALNRQWTFRHEGGYVRSLILFGLVVVLSYLANLGVVLACTRHFGISVYLSQLAGVATYAIASFLGARYIAFPERQPIMKSSPPHR